MGLTRSAIWKFTQQFQTLGIALESVTGKGYRIQNGFSLLDKNKIEGALNSFSAQTKTDFPYPDVEIWDSLASTNDYLMAKPKTTPNLCCLAEHQTQGKGRQGRPWTSPFGSNLYFSLLWNFSCDLSELSGLSLVAAIAIVKVLHQFGIKEGLGLKWPNDVLWNQKKLSGVLIEVSGETQNTTRAVIGIGINVAMPKEIGQKITQDWTDLSQITGKFIDRNSLATSLLNELVSSLQKFQTEGFQAFMNDWQLLDLCFEKELSILRASDKLQGYGHGINDKGHFLLRETSGNVKTFSSGEVSLRLN